ncbi:sigma-70 family RNA polymerase sigma factor [Candidatus Woesearchaeota archaeon]|nr:sigma-70 family RNA polymerase sigma factor [Candidatus Woesearchaeota archaeon]
MVKLYSDFLPEWYLEDLSRTRIHLTREDTLDNFKIMRYSPDVSDEYQEAFTKVYSANRDRVVEIVGKKRRSRIPFMDQIMGGNVGLYDAILKFNPEISDNFESFSNWWIEDGLKEVWCQNYKKNYKMTKVTLIKILKFGKLREKKEKDLGRRLSISELSDAAKITYRTARKYTTVLNTYTESMYEHMFKESHLTLEDKLEDEKITEDTKRQEDKDYIVEELVSSLKDKREKEIILLNWGLKGNQMHTYEELSTIFGVSVARIGQLSKRALEKLKAKHLENCMTGLY